MAPAASQKEAAAARATGMPAAPPPGTGNLSLDELCLRYGLDPASVAGSLSKENLRVERHMTIKQIAEAHGAGPAEIYERIRLAAGKSKSAQSES